MASALDMYLKKNKKSDPYAGKKAKGKKSMKKGKGVMDEDMEEECEVETVSKSKKRSYLKD